MSRGFDGFEIDDFRDFGWERDSRASEREPSRGRDGNSATERSTARKLERLREAERSLDVPNLLSQERSNQPRPPLAREEQQRSTLSSSRQTIYADRDRSYSFRDSEIHTLSEVGRFRVVDTSDLAQFAYSGDRSRMERDVYSLVRQGLAEQHGTSVLKQDSRQIIRLHASQKCFFVREKALQYVVPRFMSRTAHRRSCLIDHILEDFQLLEPVTDEQNSFVIEQVLQECQNAVLSAGVA